jgi:hypothetical protein
VSTLEQIENDYWGDPPRGASSLIERCHRYRQVPVDELGVEGLRMLIGQEIGLPVLMPLALTRLEADPLAEGDFYEGDLLASVLRLSGDYWRAHPEQATRVQRLTEDVETDIPSLARDISAFRTSGY